MKVNHKKTPIIYKDNFDSGIEFGRKEAIDEVLKLIKKKGKDYSTLSVEFLLEEVEKLKNANTN